MGANAGETMARFFSSSYNPQPLPIPPSLALELWSFNVSSITRTLSTSLCVARVMIEGEGKNSPIVRPNQFDPITATTTNPFLFQLSRIGQRESRSEGRVISTPPIQNTSLLTCRRSLRRLSGQADLNGGTRFEPKLQIDEWVG